MRVLVTGANGFVGRALCRLLLARGWQVRGAVRAMNADFPDGAEPAVVGDIDSDTDWTPFLANIDAVAHLAARVHVMHETAADPLAEFRAINVEATMALARQAAAAGVRRFVFVSTVKVMGEGKDAAYTEVDREAPQDAYAVSKYEAEQGLLRLAGETRMGVAILRPPLVYGPEVGGNFIRLIRLARGGWPLPLGSVRNRRSLLYVDNLADAIRVVAQDSTNGSRIFFVSDGEDVSTPELVMRLAAQEDRKPRLIRFPLGVLRLAGWLSGRAEEVQRLLGSLYVDSSHIRAVMHWNPPYSLERGLLETMRRTPARDR